MKFVIAPDKFKGSLTGFEFCDAVEKGMRMVFKDVEILKKPLADGGDGTIEVVKYYLNGEKITVTVNDPLFRPIAASYLYSPENNIAFIEMAEASGLKLLKDAERNCMRSTTLGTGELIADALKKGAKEVILGIGGSATNDGGMGMAHALGYRFLDESGQELQPVGSNLMSVKSIDDSKIHPQLQEVMVKVACDVSNPLYGPNGAAKVYGAQKGASEKEIELLDAGLQNYSKTILKQYDIDLQQTNGSGAAGGIGGGAIVFLNGKLISGIDLIKELANFDTAIEGSDWIITGEGKLDGQTLSGKTIDGVLHSAKRQGIQVAALCGIVDISEEIKEKLGLAYIIAVSEGISDIQLAMDSAYKNVVKSAFEFAMHLK